MSGGVVIITEAGAEQTYVANRLCAAVPVEAILVTDPIPNRSWQTVLKKSVLEFVDKALWRIFLMAVRDDEKRTQGLQRVLGREATAGFAEASKAIPVGRPKAGKLRREIERLAPDFIAVYGTGMIPNSVLGKARVKAFNMHTGVSPDYRGTDCAFWPIYYGQPELVGATVHECTDVVDGGEIYRVVRAPLYRGDDLHMIFARAVKAGADAYAEVLREAVDGRLSGHKQDHSRGREFRGYMRGIRVEIPARLRLSGLRRAWPAEPAAGA